MLAVGTLAVLQMSVVSLVSSFDERVFPFFFYKFEDQEDMRYAFVTEQNNVEDGLLKV